MKLIAKQLENRFPPRKWNIYVFYFTDGENWPGDNETFSKTLTEQFPPNTVNFVGLAQILSWTYQGSLKEHVDKACASIKNIKTTSVEPPDASNSNTQQRYSYGTPQLSDDERDAQVRRAIIDLIGKEKVKK